MCVLLSSLYISQKAALFISDDKLFIRVLSQSKHENKLVNFFEVLPQMQS